MESIVSGSRGGPAGPPHHLPLAHDRPTLTFPGRALLSKVCPQGTEAQREWLECVPCPGLLHRQDRKSVV